MNYLVIYLIIIFFIYLIFNNLIKYELFTNYDCNIPKIIISTIQDKNKIPDKVYKNIKQFASNYNHIIYDDNQVTRFIQKYYGENVLNAFFNLNGAHKADLFRYCYLYVNGGVYLDIKTKLIKDLDLVFNKKNVHFYTSLSWFKGTIYQGIIASKPKNPIFLNLIDYMVSIEKPVKKYFSFTRDFHKNLRFIYGHNVLTNGYYEDPKHKYNLYLFKEICTRDPSQCEDGLDRYNQCCYIYDNEEKVIKVRYSDYPWK